MPGTALQADTLVTSRAAGVVISFSGIGNRLQLFAPPLTSLQQTITPGEWISGNTFIDDRGRLFVPGVGLGLPLLVYERPYSVPSLQLLVPPKFAVEQIAERSDDGALVAQGSVYIDSTTLLIYSPPYGRRPPRVVHVSRNRIGQALVFDNEGVLYLAVCCDRVHNSSVLIYPPPYDKPSRVISNVLGIVNYLHVDATQGILFSSEDWYRHIASLYYEEQPYARPHLLQHLSAGASMIMNKKGQLFYPSGDSRVMIFDPPYQHASSTVTVGKLPATNEGGPFAFDQRDDLFVLSTGCYACHRNEPRQVYEIFEYPPPYTRLTWSTGVLRDPRNDPPGSLSIFPTGPTTQ